MGTENSRRPPAYQIAITLISAAFLLTAVTLGTNVEYWHGIYVRAVCALSAPFFLLMTMHFAFASRDDYRRDHPDDDNL